MTWQWAAKSLLVVVGALLSALAGNALIQISSGVDAVNRKVSSVDSSLSSVREDIAGITVRIEVGQTERRRNERRIDTIEQKLTGRRRVVVDDEE